MLKNTKKCFKMLKSARAFACQDWTFEGLVSLVMRPFEIRVNNYMKLKWAKIEKKKKTHNFGKILVL